MDFIDSVFNAAEEEETPRLREALRGPHAEEWKTAVIKEFRSHQKNKTFGPALDKVPEGLKPIPFDVILKLKRSGLRKARGIIKGFFMQAGIDFNETFAPVPVVTTIRTLIAIGTKYDWEMLQGDVETAFLASDMDAEIYVAIQKVFSEDPDPDAVGVTYHRVLKGVPGIPQGPRLFHRKSNAAMTSEGLVQCKSDHSLYVCKIRHLYICIWVDDIFLFCPRTSLAAARQCWKGLQQKLSLGDWEDIGDCLGVQVTRDRPNRTTSLSQAKAFNKLLQATGMADCSPADTPMVPGTALTKRDCPPESQPATDRDKQLNYRSVAASFINFCNWTRPDLCLSTSKACRFMHNPGPPHHIALKRMLRYLAGTVDLGLVYKFNPDGSSRADKTGVWMMLDAAHADCPDTLRSTMAYVGFFDSCPICWQTKLHTLITLATNHSEYCAAAKAGREAKWLEKLFVFLGFGNFVLPIDMFSDSKGSIAMTYNPVNRAATKHIALADHYVRELQELGTVTVSWISTKQMIADLLTKPLGREDFERLRACRFSKKAPPPVTAFWNR
jgi:hypothetical protein